MIRALMMLIFKLLLLLSIMMAFITEVVSNKFNTNAIGYGILRFTINYESKWLLQLSDSTVRKVHTWAWTRVWMWRNEFMYRDASHLWSSFSHNRTKLNIQFLNDHKWMCFCTMLCIWSGMVQGTPAESPKSWQYEKILLPRCIHHFKSGLINNMGTMRISGHGT